MEYIGEKIIRLQDAGLKVNKNGSNETSIFVDGTLADKLSLVDGQTQDFIIEKSELLKLLCFAFSYRKQLYFKDVISLDLSWFSNAFNFIENHYQTSSVFTFKIAHQSQNRYYFNSIKQASGLNIRKFLIQDHVKFLFYKDGIDIHIKFDYSENKLEDEFCIKQNNLRKFVLDSFMFLHDSFDYELMSKNISYKNRDINGTTYKGIVFTDYFKGEPLLAIFDNSQTKDSLKTGSDLRFHVQELNFPIITGKKIYISNQWKDIADGTLTFENYARFVKDYSKGEYLIDKVNREYILIKNDLELNVLNDTDKQYQIIKHEDVFNTIYFGAPGTGKSHTVDALTKDLDDKFVEKVTFHPEYDHLSFVGCYKPKSVGDDIKYEFSPQVFTNIYSKAWNDQDHQYYLVIDEINRGNCAEVFGDLFQLLDRNDNGFSKYEITPSDDLKKYLIQEFGGESKGILNGKMRLPANLVILATMNTSDQSLYPMDSAFKRRWDWVYVPIEYRDKCSDGRINDSFTFEVELEKASEISGIKVPVRTFRWIEFIEAVNDKIKGNINLGADKQIGNYFVKPKHNGEGFDKISLKDFIHKVMFYLWNDVFKDEEDSIFGKNTYQDLFPIKDNGLKIVEWILENEMNIPFDKKVEEETVMITAK